MIKPIYIIIAIIILGIILLISGVAIRTFDDDSKIGLLLIFMGMVMLPGIPPL